jgi:hypothetical protein
LNLLRLKVTTNSIANATNAVGLFQGRKNSSRKRILVKKLFDAVAESAGSLTE